MSTPRTGVRNNTGEIPSTETLPDAPSHHSVAASSIPAPADLLPGADLDAFAISGPRPPGIPTPIRTAYPYDEPGVAHE